MVHEKNWRCESLRSGTLSSTMIFSEFLAAIPVCQNGNGVSPLLAHNVVSPFYRGFLGFMVGLVNRIFEIGLKSNGSLRFFPFNMFTWHRYWIGIYPTHVFPCSSLATLSLDTVEDVIVGEVDELEEDVGWSISCLESVIDVEEGKLEEELVDKSGTTFGTKFSMLHCIRIPSVNEMWFLTVDPFHMSIRVHRKDFLAIKLLAYPRGLSWSRKNPILWHKLWCLHSSALHHWLL